MRRCCGFGRYLLAEEARAAIRRAHAARRGEVAAHALSLIRHAKYPEAEAYLTKAIQRETLHRAPRQKTKQTEDRRPFIVNRL